MNFNNSDNYSIHKNNQFSDLQTHIDNPLDNSNSYNLYDFNNTHDTENTENKSYNTRDTHDTHTKSGIDAAERNETNDKNRDAKFKYGMFLLNNGWNERNEQLLVSIGHNAYIYKKIHHKVHRHFKFFNYIYTFLLVVLNGGLSTQAIFYSSSIESDPSIQKTLIIISTLLTFIYNFLRLQEKDTQHSQYSKSFSELYHDIQNQMCMYRKDRSNAIKYVFRILKKYDHLTIAGPNIPFYVHYKLEQLYDLGKFKTIHTDETETDNAKIDIITEHSKSHPNNNDNNDNNNNNNNNNNNIQFDIKHLSEQVLDSPTPFIQTKTAPKKSFFNKLKHGSGSKNNTKEDNLNKIGRAHV
jgi:hypothetical protein